MSLLLSRYLSSLRHLSSSSTTTATPLLWKPIEEQTLSFPLSTVQILSWGRGSSGQLGGGKQEIRFYPTLLASLLLLTNFRLSPVPGRLGLPPVRPTTAADVEVGVACGLFHSAVIIDGRVWIWGKGDGGRLGFGDERSVFAPTLNENLDGVRSVALGGIHSAAVPRAGEVFTCLQGLWRVWSSRVLDL